MRGAGSGIGRAVRAAVIFTMPLSAIAARAASEDAGPPCSATVRDHCMEGGAAGSAKIRHKHVARHHKPQMAMAKSAGSVAAKPASPASAKPKAK